MIVGYLECMFAWEGKSMSCYFLSLRVASFHPTHTSWPNALSKPRVPVYSQMQIRSGLFFFLFLKEAWDPCRWHQARYFHVEVKHVNTFSKEAVCAPACILYISRTGNQSLGVILGPPHPHIVPTGYFTSVEQLTDVVSSDLRSDSCPFFPHFYLRGGFNAVCSGSNVLLCLITL